MSLRLLTPASALLLSAALLSALLASPPALADTDPATAAEIAALRAELAALAARLAELEARNGAPAPVVEAESLAASTPAPAPEPPSPPAAPEGPSVTLGGRMHFDAYAFDQGQVAVTGGTELRRMRFQINAEFGDWAFEFQHDLAPGGGLEGLRDLHLTRKFGDWRLRFGHLKPARVMDELTSSNNLMLMERSPVSASGLFAGRQFQQGVNLAHGGARHSLAATIFNTRSAGAARNEGLGLALRGTVVPWQNDAGVLHLGGWYSREDSAEGTPLVSALSNYGGRRGPQRMVASTVAGPRGGIDAAGLELAGHQGRWRFQGEWAYADFLQAVGADQRVKAGYLQAGVLLGDGAHRYKAAEGIYAGPKPGSDPLGLWELSARVDRIYRESGPDYRSQILGLTWYATPGLRFMLNYTRGEDVLTGDQPRQLALRAQYAF